MAQEDFFLKLDGIEGESTKDKHKNEIEIESWSWHEAQLGTSSHGGGSAAGRVKMEDFQFAMRVNKASPKLMMYCAKGLPVKNAVLTCRKAGGEQQDYVKWTFTDVLISSYHAGGGGSGEIVPMDKCSFNFTKVEFEYKEQKPDGSLGGPVKTWYDIKQTKGG